MLKISLFLEYKIQSMRIKEQKINNWFDNMIEKENMCLLQLSLTATLLEISWLPNAKNYIIKCKELRCQMQALKLDFEA